MKDSNSFYFIAKEGMIQRHNNNNNKQMIRHTVKSRYCATPLLRHSRYYATPLLRHSRYYAAFDRPQRNSIEIKVTMPLLYLDTMLREI